MIGQQKENTKMKLGNADVQNKYEVKNHCEE